MLCWNLDYALTSRTLDLGFRVVISQPDFRRGLVSLDFGWILQFKLSLVFHAKGLVFVVYFGWVSLLASARAPGNFGLQGFEH